MSPPREGDVVIRAEGAEGLGVGAEFVVLDPQGQTLRGLNQTAAFVWDRADGSRSLQAIAAELAAECGEAEHKVLPHVLAFAAELSSLGLLSVRAAARGGRS